MNERVIIDDKFLARLRKGDVRTFHQLYNEIAPSMKMVCKRYVKNGSDVDDVFHEGFLKVYKHIGTLKNADSFWGWLKRIFINTALDHNRKSKDGNSDPIENGNEPKVDDSDGENDVPVMEDLQSNGNCYETIRRIDFSQEEMLDALMNIPEHFRVVFQLFVVDGYKHQEISEMLLINEKTSKTRLLRARGLLREELYKMAIQKLRDGKNG